MLNRALFIVTIEFWTATAHRINALTLKESIYHIDEAIKLNLCAHTIEVLLRVCHGKVSKFSTGKKLGTSMIYVMLDDKRL